MITQKVDKIAQELEQNVGEKQENGAAAKENTFYSSVAYLQFSDDTRQLDELREKGDYEGLLTLAKEYYDGNGINVVPFRTASKRSLKLPVWVNV